MNCSAQRSATRGNSYMPSHHITSTVPTIIAVVYPFAAAQQSLLHGLPLDVTLTALAPCPA
jgi:hypothetical protein